MEGPPKYNAPPGEPAPEEDKNPEDANEDVDEGEEEWADEETMLLIQRFEAAVDLVEQRCKRYREKVRKDEFLPDDVKNRNLREIDDYETARFVELNIQHLGFEVEGRMRVDQAEEGVDRAEVTGAELSISAAEEERERAHRTYQLPYRIVEEYSSSKDPSRRRFAARHASFFKFSQAEPIIRKLLNDHDESVRKSALKDMDRVCRTESISEAARSYERKLDMLQSVIEGEDEPLRREVPKVLLTLRANWGSPEEENLPGKDALLARYKAMRTSLAKDPDREVRLVALDTSYSRYREDEGDKTLLYEFLKDPDPVISDYARELIEGPTEEDERATQPLKEEFEQALKEYYEKGKREKGHREN